MKLVETVEGRPDEWRSTALGNEVCVDVVKVFLGVWAPTPNVVPDGPNNAVGARKRKPGKVRVPSPAET